MQSPFISHAASLPVESEPFWKGPVVRRGVTAGVLSILQVPLVWVALTSRWPLIPHTSLTHLPGGFTILGGWRWSPSLLRAPQLPAGGRQALPPALGTSTLLREEGNRGEEGRRWKGRRFPSSLWARVWLLASHAVTPRLPPRSRAGQRGAQARRQRGPRARTGVKIEKASRLLIFCLMRDLKAFLQNCPGPMPTKVQNSPSALYYDNDDTGDIFN